MQSPRNTRSDGNRNRGGGAHRNSESSKKESRPFQSYNQVIAYMKNAEKNIDPSLVSRGKNKWENIISFIKQNSNGKRFEALRCLLSIFTSDPLKNYSLENGKTDIYSIFFKRKEFLLSDVFTLYLFHCLYPPKLDEIKLIFNFLEILGLSLPDKIDAIKDFIKRTAPAFSNDPTGLLKQLYIRLIQTFDESQKKKLKEIYSLETVYPTQTILTNSNFFSANQYESGYKDSQSMIDTIKMLEIENFIISVRKNLKLLEAGKLHPSDLYLYENVYLLPCCKIGFFNTSLFLHFEVRVPPNWDKRITINWSKSRRLTDGNLILVSRDPNCATLDAVCISRAKAEKRFKESKAFVKILNEGILPVGLVSGSILPNVPYYMFESPETWFPHEICLKMLKDMPQNPFPNLYKQVIRHEFECEPINTTKTITKPRYLIGEENCMNALAALAEFVEVPPETVEVPVQFDPNVLFLNPRSGYINPSTQPEKWFRGFSNEKIDSLLRVDHEQLAALTHFMQYPLTLVNGDPGTGKTHLAREIVRVLNTETLGTPTFIISQTNHSLDAFLEGIIEFVDPNSIIRNGGKLRTNNQIIKSRVLKRKDLTSYLKDSGYFDILHYYEGGYQAMQGLNYMVNVFSTLAINLSIVMTIPGMEENCVQQIIKTLSPMTCFFSDSAEIIDKIHGLHLSKLQKDILKNTGKEINNETKWKFWLLDGFKDEFEAMINATFSTINMFNALKDDDSEDEIEADDFNSDDEESFVFPDKIPKKRPPDRKIVNKTLNKFANFEEEEEEDEDERDDIAFLASQGEEVKDFNLASDLNKLVPHVWNAYKNEILCILKHYVASPERTPIQNMLVFLQKAQSRLIRLRKNLILEIEKVRIGLSKCECDAYAQYYKQFKFIGMTATFALIFKGAIEKSGCKYMIIEEVGELSEASTIGLIPSTIEHLCLIGDYNQLRPKVDYELTNEVNKKASYDISTFERLCRAQMKGNKQDLFTLTLQRRMHPEIASLVKHIFCHSMRSAVETESHQMANGTFSHISFFLHDEKEEGLNESRSKKNKYEAMMCAYLVLFYRCRGFKPNDITVIALYKGQMMLIKEELLSIYNSLKRKKAFQIDPFPDNTIRNVNIQCIDNFQGEENKVTIISITRSDKIGFVKTDNRILVTLSRARNVLCVIGNRSILTAPDSGKWPDIIRYLQQTNEKIVAKGIWSQNCPIHNKDGKPTLLFTPESFVSNLYSTCSGHICGDKLPCGHICRYPCHYNHDHSGFYCISVCDHICEHCQHPCKQLCYQCQERGVHFCTTKVECTFPCMHTCQVTCYEKTHGTAKCTHTCDVPLECGHKCGLICGHLLNGVDHQCKHSDQYKCPVCQQISVIFCGEEWVCHQKCNFVLPCGHKCTGYCHNCQKNGHIKDCKERCLYIFPCGHRCDKICSSKAADHQHLVCTECKNMGMLKEPPKDYAPKHCSKKCDKCGKQCLCLEGERCFFGCKHDTKSGPIKEWKKKDLPLFCFPCGCAEPLNDAKARIFAEENVVHYPCCANKEHHDPLTDSTVFAEVINKATMKLNRYWKLSKKYRSQCEKEKDTESLRHKWRLVICECGQVNIFDEDNKNKQECHACKKTLNYKK